MLARAVFVILYEEKEREKKREKGQHGCRERNQPGASRGWCGDEDEARLVAGDLTVDPRLIGRHSGVDAWKTFQTAVSAKTHHACLDPLRCVFGHQRAARISLHRWNSRAVRKNYSIRISKNSFSFPSFCVNRSILLQLKHTFRTFKFARKVQTHLLWLIF